MKKQIPTMIGIISFSALTLVMNTANAQLRDRDDDRRNQAQQQTESRNAQTGNERDRNQDSEQQNSILQEVDSRNSQPDVSPAILRGLAKQTCQAIDPFVIDDVRNFLFGPPGIGGFDLVSLNIQRGRDHGLPAYNDVREALGLSRKTSFNQISRDPQIRQRLSEAYISVDNIDVWVGGLSEDPQRGAMVGELVSTALVQQFVNLRDGDRFWYQNIFSGEELRQIEDTRLSDVIRRNTEISGREIQGNVFRASR